MEECYFCKKKYKQQKDAGVVFCLNDKGRIVCKSCWDKFSGQLTELLKYMKVEDIRVMEE